MTLFRNDSFVHPFTPNEVNIMSKSIHRCYSLVFSSGDQIKAVVRSKSNKITILDHDKKNALAYSLDGINYGRHVSWLAIQEQQDFFQE